LTAVIVCADPQPIPNSPWVQDQQTVKVEALTSMEELQKKLFNIYARSKGRMEVEIAGETTLGYSIDLSSFRKADDEETKPSLKE
jgi:hypothetical protein